MLFRNPKSTGLVSALNVRGTITGIDLYRVDETIILFGCQMVGVEKAIDEHDQIQENKEQLSDNNVGVYDILEEKK